MKKENRGKLKIIPLGGLEQIGMNITAFEYEDSIIVVDCGLAFPEDDMLGIDLVIPDVTYLKDNISKVKGFVITHGHEDHIGALPYVLKEINLPIYTTKLTMGIIENKLKEHNLLRTTKRKVVRHGQSINLGQFRIEFIKTNHSIQDASALAIYSPAGTVVHTGDFKVDYTPVFGDAIDLQRFAEIELLIDGKMMNQVQSCDRDIAMVFQNYALYPHMTVFENMAYSLRLKKVPKKERRQKVEEAAKILGLEGVLDRKPGELSGGQKQRVAMGRAIVRNPRIFLMDEPLSNLDAKLRTQMRAEILRLYQKLKTTFIYVTHDQTEAMTLGTKIVVMKDGVIQQVASPEELYNCPANTFVAGFIGMPPMNFFQGKCCRGGEYGTYLQIGDFAVDLTEEDAERVFRKGYMGEVITVGVRPEDLVLTEEGTEHEVMVYEMLGAETYLYFTYEGKDVALRTNADTPYRRGDRISFCLRNDKLHLFDGDTGIRI